MLHDAGTIVAVTWEWLFKRRNPRDRCRFNARGEDVADACASRTQRSTYSCPSTNELSLPSISRRSTADSSTRQPQPATTEQVTADTFEQLRQNALQAAASELGLDTLPAPQFRMHGASAMTSGQMDAMHHASPADTNTVCGPAHVLGTCTEGAHQPSKPVGRLPRQEAANEQHAIPTSTTRMMLGKQKETVKRGSFGLPCFPGARQRGLQTTSPPATCKSSHRLSKKQMESNWDALS